MDTQTARNVVADQTRYLAQRTLHTVEDALQQSGPEFDGQRMTETADRLAGTQALRRFLRLHDCILTLERDDLADDVQAADAHLFPIAPTGQIYA
jgi:hypothetical protein